jgi:low affinity Fe/Cu permease
MNDIFRKIAHSIAHMVGTAKAFMVAVVLIIIWFVSGFYFDFSNTWQLMINTGTTITTFLMVFLIQNTQNRDAKAIHLKLDELIRSGRGRNSYVDLEELSDEELTKLEDEFRQLRTQKLKKQIKK